MCLVPITAPSVTNYYTTFLIPTVHMGMYYGWSRHSISRSISSGDNSWSLFPYNPQRHFVDYESLGTHIATWLGGNTQHASILYFCWAKARDLAKAWDWGANVAGNTCRGWVPCHILYTYIRPPCGTERHAGVNRWCSQTPTSTWPPPCTRYRATAHV